jgi:putative transposase
LKGKDDGLVRVSPLLEIAGDWRRLLTSAESEEQLAEFREHERTGRVLGDDKFQKRLEKRLGRVLRRQKPGPKKVSKR